MSLNLKSERQVQSEILAKLIAELNLNDVNKGSVVDILTQAIAQQDFALYYQIAQVTRLVDLDALSGEDLDNKAFEYGLTRIQKRKATGTVTVLRPSGFVKVSTTFYAGSPPPIVGDTQIDVNDASNALIGSSGSLIIGRGTNNEEEITYSVAPVDNTTYFRFTLDNPLANDHSIEETIILKQGNDEAIIAGTILVVAATGVAAEIKFKTVNDEVLLAGEDKLEDVEIIAIEAGADGNIGIGAIDGEAAFGTPPFIGARAHNDAKFVSGAELETDDELRDRIKNSIQGITRAVKQAILNAIVGLVDPETAKRVVSAAVILPIEEAGAVKIYIDDGTGFEPSFESIGFETILAKSTGGEQRLQLDKFPVVKAQVQTNISEPYNMSSGVLNLSYQVGNISETVTFNPADFSSSQIATAEEIVGLINDRSTIIEARTSQIGKYIVLTAKADTNENIQVTGGSANSILNFPTDRKETVNIYVDDIKKSKDGLTATLDSDNSSPYNLLAVGPFPHTLTMVIDGKTANPQTATLNSADVADQSAVTVTEIIAALNRDLVGVIASGIDNSTRVRLQSLTKLSTSSKLRVTGGSLNNSINGLKFSTVEQVGVNGDYLFNRETGTLEFVIPLSSDSSVTANSQFTRGHIISGNPELFAPANGQTLVIRVDGGSDQTVTFDTTFSSGKTAQQTCDYINSFPIRGAIATVRSIGGDNYIQISTNTYKITGSISIRSTSTSNAAFGFQTNTTYSSTAPAKAFLLSGTSGPYQFAQDDSLVVVVDDDIVNSTYSVLMNYADVVTTSSSTTVFRASGLSQIFPNSNQLNSYYASFTDGNNTDTGLIESVALQGGGVARYTFNPAPVNMTIFASGDLFKSANLNNSENNGNFIIITRGSNYVDVSNPDAVAATAQTGLGTLSQRRQISSYNNGTGQITVSTPFSNAPQVADSLIVIPSTIINAVDYLNNTKITSLSLKAIIESADNRTKVQLSSKKDGSDGAIQVTGGAANDKMNFNTVIYKGLAAYSYWTGLLALVHKTIYGDDSDPASFPGYGAAGIIFRVLAPTVRQVEIQLDVTLSEGVTISSLENEIKSAVTGYINTLGVGEDVIIERIRAAVIGISGIIDVVVNSPTENIAIADNEVARIADPNVLIG